MKQNHARFEMNAIAHLEPGNSFLLHLNIALEEVRGSENFVFKEF